MKSRLQLDLEIMELIRGREPAEITSILTKRYRVHQFKKLTIEQLMDFVEFLKGDEK